MTAGRHGLPVETVSADARDFHLPGRTFPLIVVPMQTLQLLGGGAGHLAFLRCARGICPWVVLSRSRLAAADDFEEFEWHEGDVSPLPDIAENDGAAYFSQPTAVRRMETRSYSSAAARSSMRTAHATSCADSIALDVVTVEDCRTPAQRTGLRPLGLRTIGLPTSTSAARW